MPKVLITGVAGLIGSHFSAYLADKGYQVFGVDDLSGGYRDFIPSMITFYELDLSDRDELAKLFIDVKPDYVYHFAAYAAEGLSPFIRNFNYQNNLVCSINVINECIKNSIKKIIFTSSMAVYGIGNPPFTEEQIPHPEDPYGISKYAVEMDLRQAKSQFGLDYIIFRPHNVIGIYQNIWDKYRNVIGIWIRNVLVGKSIVIFGDGEQKRAFSDIKFCLPTMEKVMTQFSGEIFNLGSDKEYTLNEAAQIMQAVSKEFGYSPAIEHLEARQEVKNAYCSHEKAKKLLDFRDETILMETVREMFTWAIKQPPREVKEMNYEIDKGMYRYWK